MKHLVPILITGLLAVSCIINVGGGAAIVGSYTEDGIDYSEVREVGPFRGLVSSLPANVYYEQADAQEVRVESTEELADKVITVVEDGILKLRLEEGRYPKLILRVVVSSPDIESLHAAGSGKIIHKGILHTDGNLNLKVSGSGDFRVGSVDCRDLAIQCSGSGSIRIDGVTAEGFEGKASGSGGLRIDAVSCDGFNVTVSGSGGISIDRLTAKGNTAARTSGSGRIRLREVAVEGDMDLKTSGSGGIDIHGRCHGVTATTTGSGSISGHLDYTGINAHSSGSGRVRL